MEKRGLWARFRALFDPAGVRKYVTQVSLILVSLLIATRAEKCREAAKDREKLREYLTAVRADVADELETCAMNLGDCERDIACLATALGAWSHTSADSVYAGLAAFAEVYQRGVFRSFPPTTFDMMLQSGDANLLKDLALRGQLAAAFAFRNNVLRKDLEGYDQATTDCAERLGEHFDLTRLFSGDLEGAILDKKVFSKSPHNEVFLLLRVAQLRGFHLANAVENFEEVQKSLDDFLQKL